MYSPPDSVKRILTGDHSCDGASQISTRRPLDSGTSHFSTCKAVTSTMAERTFSGLPTLKVQESPSSCQATKKVQLVPCLILDCVARAIEINCQSALASSCSPPLIL